MDDKEVAALFARHAKIRLTIIEDSKQERRQIKNSFRENKITNILECDDYDEAWEKLQLSSTSVLIFKVSDKDGEDFLNQIIESTRFRKTPLIIFTTKIGEYPKLYSTAEVIAEWVEAPINALKVEKALVRTLQNGVVEKSLVGSENISLEYFTAGVAALAKGDFGKAKESFRMALKESPGFFEAYVKMAETLVALGENQTAKRVLERALKISGNNPGALLIKCDLAVKMEEKDKAIETLDNAVGKRPDDLKFIIDVGNIALKKGWADEAVKYFEMAKSIDPNLLHVYNRLGIAHSRAGRFDKAVEMYESALRLDDKDAGIHFNIGMAHHRKGDDAAALGFFKAAAKMDPDIQEAKDWIEKLSS
ncbi:hypothetical protein MNBD_NITROSPINAE02-488 [hydrothermal vent metagenome]|uniref:Uncharacterized protein n=1 Tax=hydrothermal vent metagenome TaxID=652676 RepID=A0A3B1C2U6_9ZZZZ